VTLNLAGEPEYRAHFIANFTGRPLTFRTSSGSAPVYFSPHDFDHAFYESTRRDGAKDQFSRTRAERMDEIAPVLASGSSDRFAGWDARSRSYDHTRCVCVASGDFVVVVRLGLTRVGALRGNFVTCYVADNSIRKIRQSPNWNEAYCVETLTQRKGR
jgi:hypothetical protein